MKQFITKTGTVSNWPIKETKISEGSQEIFESIAIELTEEQAQNLQEGSLEIEFKKSEPKLIPSTKKAEREAERLSMETEKQAVKEVAEKLKKKLEKGEATLEEIQKTLAKLI